MFQASSKVEYSDTSIKK